MTNTLIARLREAGDSLEARYGYEGLLKEAADRIEALEQQDRAIRRLFCAAATGTAAYMDDGEAPCHCIDCLRNSAEEIQSKRMERVMKKFKPTALVQPALYRLMHKEGTAWIPASEWMTEADSSWLKLAQDKPDEWCIKEPLDGKKVTDALRTAFAFGAAPQQVERPTNCGTSFCACIECIYKEISE